MRIPLFDIDGTLFTPNSQVSYDAFTYAIKKAYGLHATQSEINPQGMVDNQVALEVLKLHGLTEKQVKEKIDAQNQAVVEYAQIHRGEIHPEVLPGVKETLSALRDRHIPIGVLTGNVEGLAWVKLAGAGIRDFFDFGSFGNLAFKRADLVEIARQRAETALGKPFKTQDFVIIGDTPKDIQCARDADIEVIAVASGNYPFDELIDEKPDLLLHTLVGQEQRVIDFLSGDLRTQEGQARQTENK